MRKIKWGVLGTSYIFERDTARGMALAQNCELVAVAGRTMEKALAFKEKYGFQRAYGSYEALLEDPEIEAVYIALPNTLHHMWTMQALKKGKHVLCEKPLTPTEKEAAELFRTAKENGVFLMEAFAYQHSPLVWAVKEELEKGTIGEVRYMEAALITSDYDMSNIRMRRETLGGCTYDLGVYAISLIQRMMGKEPEQVQAIATFNEEHIDTYTTGIFTYDNGAKANFACGMVLATERNSALDRFQIHGTKGAIIAGHFAFNLPGTLSYRIKTFDGVDEVRFVEVPNNYCLEVEQLGRCIAEGQQPVVSAEFSTQLARTVDRVLQAINY